MSLLSMMEARLPPGFRFHPRDEELICDYLAKKVAGDGDCLAMIDIDLNKCEPWELTQMACVGGKEWYFFSLKDRKYATGQRTNRATQSGYWKATGKDRVVVRKGVVVGMRKTLVFYQGRAPKGKKTDWVMHEFRMKEADVLQKSSLKEDWVLCRVFYKSTRASKSNLETCYDDTGSSSLPPITDTPHIVFNQTPHGFKGYEQTPHGFKGYEQVPCFSNPQLRNPSNHQVPETSFAARVSTHFGGFPDLSSGLSFNPLVPCHQKGINAVMNQFTNIYSSQKIEENLTFGEGSMASYLTETEQSSMWNTF